jgi:hypothetical protein
MTKEMDGLESASRRTEEQALSVNPDAALLRGESCAMTTEVRGTAFILRPLLQDQAPT